MCKVDSEDRILEIVYILAGCNCINCNSSLFNEDRGISFCLFKNRSMSNIFSEKRAKKIALDELPKEGICKNWTQKIEF